jgi:flagellar protein FliO/FliZ
MSIYLNAFLMLTVTVAAFMGLAKLLQVVRLRQFAPSWRRGGDVPAPASRLAVEQACVVDGKRRLLLVRCDGQRVLLLTGGPTDLVIPLPAERGAAT